MSSVFYFNVKISRRDQSGQPLPWFNPAQGRPRRQSLFKNFIFLLLLLL